MNASDWIATFSLIVSILAFVATVYSIHRSNVSASSSALATISDNFREAWRLFRDSQDEDEREYHFADLMNIFELACGFYEDGLWKGVSKELIRDYKKETLGHIKDSSDATTRIKALMTQTNTFKYLRVFLHRVEMDHHFFPINLT